MTQDKTDPFLKREIESHSSALTNLRIDRLIQIATEKILEMLSSKPDALISMELYASVLGWFISTHSLYAEPVNQQIKNEIDNSIKEGNNLMFELRVKGMPTLAEIEKLNRYSLRLFYLMVQGMQNLKHFWRLGSQEIKGIDAALDLFNLDIWKPKKIEAKV